MSAFSPDPAVVDEMVHEFVTAIRAWTTGDFLAALSSRPEKERREIVDLLFQRMESIVRAEPTQHKMDFLVAHIMIQKATA